jgi:L-amino acid N-acyltransferase YncA
MKLRYAKDSDFDFLVKGLEKNRTLENRPKGQLKAKPSDKRQLRQAIKNKNVRVIEEGGGPIAFLYFRTDFKVMYVSESFFWVDLIYVKEDHRGKGIGKLLYGDAVKLAGGKGYNKIVIDVFDANEKSRKFHTALGFKPVYTIYQKGI